MQQGGQDPGLLAGRAGRLPEDARAFHGRGLDALLQQTAGHGAQACRRGAELSRLDRVQSVAADGFGGGLHGVFLLGGGSGAGFLNR